MKHVKLTQNVGTRVKGEILRVDDASAKSLVETKKVATLVDDDNDNSGDAVQSSADRRGSVITTQVVDPDPYPGDKPAADGDESAEVVDGAGETHTGTLPTSASEDADEDEDPDEVPEQVAPPIY